MIVFIYICILALNLITIFLTYRFLGTEFEKKEKWIFVIIGIALMYVTVSGAYWLGTKDLEATSSTGQNLITFTFVPINGLLILPWVAKMYRQLKFGKMKTEDFKKRCILFGVLLLVILILEVFYFNDIQSGILNIVQAGQS